MNKLNLQIDRSSEFKSWNGHFKASLKWFTGGKIQKLLVDESWYLILIIATNEVLYRSHSTHSKFKTKCENKIQMDIFLKITRML